MQNSPPGQPPSIPPCARGSADPTPTSRGGATTTRHASTGQGSPKARQRLAKGSQNHLPRSLTSGFVCAGHELALNNSASP